MKKSVKIMIISLLSVLLIVVSAGCYAAVSFQTAKEESEAKLPTKNQNFTGDEQTSDKELTVMIVGNDSRDDDEDQGRSDTLMVAHYDGKTKQPKLISIMRDSYVTFPDGGQDKINAAYAYGGAQMTKDVLKNNFDLPINYYVVMDFKEFSDIIDELYPKGVTIEAEKDINLDGVDIFKGEQTLHGNSLLQYARFRMDEEGDFGRIRRQQQVMDALVEQSKDLIPIWELPQVAGKMVGKIDTNVPTSLLIDLAKDFLTGKVKPLKSLSVPVEGSWQFNDYTDSGSVIELDEQQNAEAIKAFMKDN
ncbi:transcriptional regulator [Enterococcus ureilyticus]|uniref:Regulatory protein MsrR n=1 Tax=Enterococcus ureilyticus TaxID=1131292 RepID=A0A1E5H950_9ENTE|nr:LCP family protein [Enterococcus ureilyticus]MBM7688384.1 LCP family protein required for cell wall assembly [Enterococcus ureilyticus]MBO0447371.1 LCP family protein [Enterococcus ureilyticus]OEG21489.1 transcriptional regulator [Enterococcus ureilyticus]